MKHTEHANNWANLAEYHQVWKSWDTSETHLAKGDRKGFRTLRDVVKPSVNSPTETIAQVGGNFIVPSNGVT